MPPEHFLRPRPMDTIRINEAVQADLADGIETVFMGRLVVGVAVNLRGYDHDLGLPVAKNFFDCRLRTWHLGFPEGEDACVRESERFRGGLALA